MTTPQRRHRKTPKIIPTENHKLTKEIIRLDLQRITLGIQQGIAISQMHFLLIETKREIDKLQDKELAKAFDDLIATIHTYWPLDEKTPWDTLEKVGRIFAFIDRQTIY